MNRLRDPKIAYLGCALAFSLISAQLASAQNPPAPQFYNVIEITDPAGDATPGAPPYVDLLKVTVRQIGQYVQFVWEAAGNSHDADKQFYRVMLDTDFNPNTGQNTGGAGAELKISIWLNHWAVLDYFNAVGGVTSEESGLPVYYEGNRVYFTLEKSKIPGESFNLFFDCSGAIPYSDSGRLVRIDLQPAQPDIDLLVEAESMVLRDNPPLIAISDKNSVIQLHAYLSQGGVKRELLPQDVEISAWHPDPGLGDPSSIVSVNSSLQARCLRDGYVFLQAMYKNTQLPFIRTIIASGKVYGDPQNDSVIGVFEPSYRLQGSAFSFGDMLTNYPDFMRTVNTQYLVTSSLYRGFRPFNGDKQVLALFVDLSICGEPGNPLQTSPGCFMNPGDGSPQYAILQHEMGHNFQVARGMKRLGEALNGRLYNAGVGEAVASLPVIYFAQEMNVNPERYGFDRQSLEAKWYRQYESDYAGAQRLLESYENLIRSGKTAGYFDNNGKFDGVAVFCLFFQAYSYGFAEGSNPYGNESVRRFLNIFDDRELSDFVEEKVETYFCAAYSIAIGKDMRDKLRFWGFTIDDQYYARIYPKLEARVSDAKREIALPGGAANATSTVGSEDPVQVGYATAAVTSGSAPYGVAVFSSTQNGVVVGEAGVPGSSPSKATRIFIDFRSNVAPVPSRGDLGAISIDTGLAVVNPGSTFANITYTLRNTAGTTISVGHGTVAGGAHFAKFIDQLKDVAADFTLPSDFPQATKYGSLDITSDQPVAVTALRLTVNQRNEALLTGTPTVDLTKPPGSTPLYFPQFVDGGGYTSTIILLNTSSAVETGRLAILGDTGTAMTVTQAGGTRDSSFLYSIQPGGIFVLQTDGAPSSASSGWVQLTPDGNTNSPAGAGVFSLSQQGVLVTESGVATATPTAHARIYLDQSGNHRTGLAIARPGNEALDLNLTAYQLDGSSTAGSGGASLKVSGNGHTAQFADQLIKGLPPNFTGVLDISSSQPFVALTLRSLTNTRDNFLLTTFPIADISQKAPSPIVFPQIADGGGYVTQFILLSAGGASSTTLNFLGEDGKPLYVGKY